MSTVEPPQDGDMSKASPFGMFGTHDRPLPFNLLEYITTQAVDMTPEELGAHLRILVHAWRVDPVGRVTADRRVLARIACATPAEWRRVEDAALRGFHLEDSMWVYPRMERAFSRALDAQAVQSGIRKRRSPLSPKLRFEILERHGFLCAYCGRGADEVALEVDHIIPVSAGGSDDPENLRAACFECNAGKRDRVL